MSAKQKKAAMADPALKVRPLHDRLLVRRGEPRASTKGVIVIPDSAREKPQQGEILAVGKGRLLEDGTRVAPDVEVGDRILFGKYTGTEVALEGQDVLILREDEILAVLA